MKTFVFALAMIVVAGCHKDNNFCPGANPDNSCAEIDAKVANGCSSNATCTAPKAVCDLAGSKTCVQCVAPDDTSACTATSPVCGGDHACRGCTAHTDCPLSDVCLPDGSCADTNVVAYVAPTGTGTACSKSSPCGILDNALQTSKPFVKIAAGLVKDTKTTTIDGKVVSIFADLGAKLDRDGDGAIIEVRSANANVSIYDLEITGASGSAGADGVLLTPNGGVPKLSLTRVKVDTNQGNGITSSGGTLTVTQSTISGNTGGGIVISGAATVFVIAENFIYRNGNTSSAAAGGISAVPSGASKLEFNTIVDNQANSGAASAGGVFCDQGAFVAGGNLIFRNTGGSTGSAQTFGNCTYGNSFVNTGTSSVDNSPAFARPNTQPFDYHLTSTSPVTIIDAAGTCTGPDFDGDARPIGAGCDLGADEYKP